MARICCFVLFAILLLPLRADDAPPIIIHSPDTARTFAYGTLKRRALIWDKTSHTLYAEVTFTDEQQDNPQAEEDTHRFALPGVTFDPGRHLFLATTAQGEPVPVAKQKKELFLNTIEILPNAVVRVYHHRGEVAVTLEAIRPADVAAEKKRQDEAVSPGTNPDGSHTIDLDHLFQ